MKEDKHLARLIFPIEREKILSLIQICLDYPESSKGNLNAIKEIIENIKPAKSKEYRRKLSNNAFKMWKDRKKKLKLSLNS